MIGMENTSPKKKPKNTFLVIECMTAYQINPDHRKPPVNPPAKKPKQRISRQRRKRLDRDAEYNAMRDIYLEENPECFACFDDATQVHHICSGVAGRAASLLNPDTWLPCCQNCHDKLEGTELYKQIIMKKKFAGDTINRLAT